MRVGGASWQRTDRGEGEGVNESSASSSVRRVIRARMGLLWDVPVSENRKNCVR